MRMDGNLNVYNLSAPGYGTDQEFLAIREFILAKPSSPIDLVSLLVSANDFEDVGDSIGFAFPKPRFSLKEGRLELQNVPVPDLGRHTQASETSLLQYPRRRFPSRNQLWLDGHLNSRGHRQLAKQLVQYVDDMEG